MSRLGHVVLLLAACWTAVSASAMDLGLRIAVWSRSARAASSAYAIGEALGADATTASLPWMAGTSGTAAVAGRDDATAAGGRSVKFSADDDSMAWVETVVTNACRVSFDWKCSCEALVKGRPFDYLSFAVDGERRGFICGETDWTNQTFYVTSDGEHVLRWVFQRDEDGSSGEDSTWLANVAVAHPVTLTFAAGDATDGTPPAPVTAYADECVVLPGQGTLTWPMHAFLGWSDGVTLYAAGSSYPLDGALRLVAQWQEEAPQTFGEYLNWPEQTFTTTDDDAAWTRVIGVSEDGYALRSGAITHSQTSRLETVVFGPGTVTFSCKVSGEVLKRIVFDGLAFCIDGVQQGDLMGNEDWATNSFEVTGAGTHTLSWLYVKDGDGDGDGEDCAWVDAISWTPAVVDPIPELATDADAEAVAAALAGSGDASLLANVTNAVQYVAYRTWALPITNGTVSAQAVKDSGSTWRSFALGADALIGGDLVSDDIRIASFVPANEAGKFEFEVSVKGVNIGSGSVSAETLRANLEKVLVIEGSATLAPGTFSPDGIETVSLDATEGGNARITVRPPTSAGSAYFMRVELNFSM